MSLKVYNVLNRKKEEFASMRPSEVKMYACGITVSDNAHVGHAYQAAIFDMIRKYLEYIGYDVKYVRNYTDVDDKIIIKSNELGVDPIDYAEKLIVKTNEELKALGIESPTIQARATECISDIIDFVKKLIDKDKAYVTDNGDVYFKVNSFANYGKFSNRIVEDSISGVRKEIEPGKKDEKDFALWKSAKVGEISWKSPWGDGRPGWHIECSTMSMKYLGEQIDIHGGGKDLVFPHHENEIAQSESLTSKKFANYWFHNGLVKINGQKMSKSLGNGILIQDLIKKYNSDVIRITLLQNNYRSDLNIVDGIFEQNEIKISAIYKLFLLIDQMSKDAKATENPDVFNKMDEEFRLAMDNDFNSSLAIANLFNYVNEMGKLINKKDKVEDLVNMKNSMIKIYKVIGILQQDPTKVVNQIRDKYMTKVSVNEDEILQLIKTRDKYRNDKNFEMSDAIRNDLLEKNIIIKDTPIGTEWDIDYKIVVDKQK